MNDYTIISTRDNKKITIKGSGYGTGHRNYITLLGVDEADHATLRDFVRNAGHDDILIYKILPCAIPPGSNVYKMDGWDTKEPQLITY